MKSNCSRSLLDALKGNVDEKSRIIEMLLVDNTRLLMLLAQLKERANIPPDMTAMVIAELSKHFFIDKEDSP